MNIALLINAVVVAGLAQLPPVEAPPAPNFKKPVDYVGWYNKQLATIGKQGNAVDDYAAFLYVKGPMAAKGLSAEQFKQGVDYTAFVLSNPKPWTAKDMAVLDKMLTALDDGQFKSLRNGNKKKVFALRPDPSLKYLATLNLPRFSSGRILTQALFAKSWKMPGPLQNPQPYADAVAASFAYTGHLHQGLTMDEQFLADGLHQAISLRITSQMPALLSKPKLAKAVLTAVEKNDSVPLTTCVARCLPFCEATAYQQIQLCTKVLDDGKVVIDGVLAKKLLQDIGKIWDTDKLSLDALPAADPVALVDATHAYFDQIRQLLATGDLRQAAAQLDMLDANTIEQNAGMRAFVTPMGLQVKGVIMAEAQRRMLHLYLRMIVHHAEKSAWPKSFDELEGADVPLCRIDPYTGKDFRMSSKGVVPVIYSVGPDGTDEGGYSGSDVVLWKP